MCRATTTLIIITMLKLQMPIFKVKRRLPDIVSSPAKIENYYTYDKSLRKWVWDEMPSKTMEKNFGKR